jgi:two-component system response regulator HydG
MARVLIIDDHEGMREGMAAALQKQGLDITAVRSGPEGLSAFRKSPFDLVVTDLKLEGMDGIEITRKVRELHSEALVMVVTAFGTVETAVAAMKEGAYDFLLKPFSPEVLRAKVEQGLSLAVTKRQLEHFKARAEVLEQDAARGLGELVGDSEPMQRFRGLLRKAAASDATVHLMGESGTGKELAARELHALSPRRDGPFVAVHCAALAESLLESELFGHEKGAFTGAIRRKLGRFELAEGGTVFLDEIGELSPAVQTKLLRVLQEREVQRVGGEETIPVNVRVVSATHRDLKAEADAGRFREDLYYRLVVVPLTLPPLRERPEDVPLLARHFVQRSAPRLNPRVRGVREDALLALQRHPWPGNVRELENTIEQALVFCEGDQLTPDELPHGFRAAPTPPPGFLPALRGDVPLPELLDSIERQLIQQAYERARGVKAETARLLGIKNSALYYKLEKYGLLERGDREDP